MPIVKGLATQATKKFAKTGRAGKTQIPPFYGRDLRRHSFVMKYPKFYLQALTHVV